MNKKIPIRIIVVVLSFAVAEPMSIGFLAPTPPPQHQAYAYTNKQEYSIGPSISWF